MNIDKFLAAIDAYDLSNYIEFDDTIPGRTSAEELVIKKDLFEKLSTDSKDIIMMILNAPEEIVSNTLPKYKGVNKSSIQNYLRRIKKLGERSLVVIEEIKQFVNEF